MAECVLCFFFFNDTATTEIYTLSLHDALPISQRGIEAVTPAQLLQCSAEQLLAQRFTEHDLRLFRGSPVRNSRRSCRSEEHTSELQSQSNLVCRLLLEKKKIQAETPNSV